MANSALHFNLGIPWTTITSSQPIFPNVAYCVNAGADVTLLLPSVLNINDAFYVYNMSVANNFSIAQSAGQSIQMIGNVTTAGVGHGVSSTGQGQFILLQCIFMTNMLNMLVDTGFFVSY